jgi:hypothetical protein
VKRQIKTTLKRPSIHPIVCQLQAMIAHFRERAKFRGVPDPDPDYWLCDYERLALIAGELAALLQRRALELSIDDKCWAEEGGV